MSRKIGEVLIDKGLLTPRQLQTALQTQLILGGHLGTNLIELGYTDEISLGRALAEIQGVRCAPREAFWDIPAEIIATVPASLARRRRVIPIGLEDRSLHLAVIDPSNLMNLSCATGYRILPYVAPEIRILQAMEDYYGIPRPARYIKVSHRAEAYADGNRAAAREKPPEPVAYERPRPKRSAASRDSQVPLLATQEVSPELEALSRRMGQVAHHGELGDVLLDYLSQRMERCVLFDVSDRAAKVVNWRGVDLDSQSMRDLALPMTTESIFALVLDDAYYHGPVPLDCDALSFYGELGIDVPGECLILPVYGDDGLEVVLYGDGGREGQIEGAGESYLLLMEKVALVVKMLSLKMQLCPA